MIATSTISIFMKSPLPNTLAVVVLIALIFTWFTSIVLSLRDAAIPTKKGWYAFLLPAFSLLGFPATIDLLQTKGITFLFAALVFIVLLLNFAVPILNISGKSSHSLILDWYKWSVLISTIGGLFVAGYLTFVEATGTQVVCGPSNGCDTVQTSRYAMLLGVLPVGILGLAGYLGILFGWLVLYFSARSIKKMATIAIWAMCMFGVLFEIYLTFLEPFVIGATCMWCICSAVLMIILLLVITPAAQQTFVTGNE